MVRRYMTPTQQAAFTIQISQAYNDGRSIRQIAASLDQSYGTVHRYLAVAAKAGTVTLRLPGGARCRGGRPARQR